MYTYLSSSTPVTEQSDELWKNTTKSLRHGVENVEKDQWVLSIFGNHLQYMLMYHVAYNVNTDEYD